jgi:hypothetical protein
MDEVTGEMNDELPERIENNNNNNSIKYQDVEPKPVLNSKRTPLPHVQLSQIQSN